MSPSTAAVSATRVRFLQIFLLFLCVVPSRAFAGDAARSPSENLRQLQALRAGYLYEELNWTVNAEFVPKPVRAKLTRLKHDLRDRIVAAMAGGFDARERDAAAIKRQDLCTTEAQRHGEAKNKRNSIRTAD